ncbi:MAG: hypothetical protein NTZ83_04650 [Candidatus Pacearchaeota archaeon]|nr:hypothetical protein [Candidatus Pacearchaeota archaeon]
MKKSLLTILLAGAISLPLYAQTQEKNNTESENYLIKGDVEIKISRERDTLKLKDWKYINRIVNEVAKRDEEYLHENTARIGIFKDETVLKSKIIKDLKVRTHTYGIDSLFFKEHYSQINELSLNQNKVIYLMLTSLRDSSFVNKIGRIIEGDIKNKYSESGGVVNFVEKNKINLKPVESELSKLRDERNNIEYQLPSEDYLSKKIAHFHMHASEYDETLSAGLGIKEILTLARSSILFGRINEFIITSLKKGEFNVDYVGVDPEKDKKIRIIDLGNYFYDTSDIKYALKIFK